MGLEGTLFEVEGVAPLPDRAARTVASEPTAAAVARIAARRFEAGEGLSPEALDANYVRRPEAELNWKARFEGPGGRRLSAMLFTEKGWLSGGSGGTGVP